MSAAEPSLGIGRRGATVAFARASAEMMMRAAQAPGTSELTRSLCRASALVLDLDQFHALQKMLDASQGPSRAHLQVICVPENAERVPSCSDVARAWLNAATAQACRSRAKKMVGAAL